MRISLVIFRNHRGMLDVRLPAVLPSSHEQVGSFRTQGCWIHKLLSDSEKRPSRISEDHLEKKFYTFCGVSVLYVC